MATATSRDDLNGVAEEYFNCHDEIRKAKIKDELWTQSWEYLEQVTRYENTQAQNTQVWSRFDIIAEAACHMPTWMDNFDPSKAQWTTYVLTMFKGMRQNALRPKNIHHRFHESAVRALNETLQSGVTPDEAIRSQLIGASPAAQEGIMDAWYAIRVKPQSLNTPIGELDGQEITLEQTIKDHDAPAEFAAVIDRTSRTPVMRKLHRRHRLIIEQLLDKVPFRFLDFGEVLSLPQKAIRISEAVARLRTVVETAATAVALLCLFDIPTPCM